MKTHIGPKQHNSTPQHKTIRPTTEVSPWNDPLYKITVGLKIENAILYRYVDTRDLYRHIVLYRPQ